MAYPGRLLVIYIRRAVRDAAYIEAEENVVTLHIASVYSYSTEENSAMALPLLAMVSNVHIKNINEEELMLIRHVEVPTE